MGVSSGSLTKPQTIADVIGFDPNADALYWLGDTQSVRSDGQGAVVKAALQRLDPTVRTDGFIRFAPGGADETADVRIAVYPGPVLRISISHGEAAFPDSPMLEFSGDMQMEPIAVHQEEGRYTLSAASCTLSWSAKGPFAPCVNGGLLEGVHFKADANFMPPPRMWEALPLWIVRRGNGTLACGFSLHANLSERFAGSGERFAPLDLRGRRIAVDNENAYGASTRRTYKSIPFLLSSRPYGVFLHSSYAQDIDVCAHCNNALQWRVSTGSADLFLVGGATPIEILKNYQRITGFPRMPPVWSFGTWMSRLTYRSAQEMLATAAELREKEIPVDVLHQDTAWFPEMVESQGFGPDNPKRALYGKCDWRFSEERFPEPKKFFSRMRDMGIRVSLWQWPHVRRDTIHSETARASRFVGRNNGDPMNGLFGDTLDLTHEPARAWYRSLLEGVLREGAVAIKADFGEWIDPGADYSKLPVEAYHNLFPLLYQQCAWEAAQNVHEEGVIWARSGWAGSQRYPIHWAGDPLSTFDSLALTLLAGQQLGMSGFAFWSHDVGGFVGQPEFLDTPPTDELYLRWTQAAVFTSHIRYHGCQPREPWHFPGVLDQVRNWLRFRYMLLPYILAESKVCCASGAPLLCALPLVWPADPMAWAAGTDQYLFGRDLLICPVLGTGVTQRAVYLPEGNWIDFWSGSVHAGPVCLRNVGAPIHRIPVYVRAGAEVEFSEPIQCTDALPSARRFRVTFDSEYPGWNETGPGALLPLG